MRMINQANTVGAGEHVRLRKVVVDDYRHSRQPMMTRFDWDVPRFHAST